MNLQHNNTGQFLNLRFGKTAAPQTGYRWQWLIALLILLFFASPSQTAKAQQLDWVRQHGGGGSAVAVDSAGNSYVTGEFNGTAIFGEGSDAVTLTSTGSSGDVYVAKYDNGGNLIWVIQEEGLNSAGSRGITVDGSGHIYVVGDFGIQMILGESNNRVTLTGGGLFLAKYNNDGSLIWAKQAADATGAGVDVDGAGNVYLIGFFTNKATFGEGDDAVTLTGSDGFIIVTAKYDPTGNLVWVKQSSGIGNTISTPDIAVDEAGNSHIISRFALPTTLGEGVNAVTLTSAGEADILIAKYDTNGKLAWAKRAGGSNFDVGWDIAVDGGSNVYTTGDFREEATFGEGTNATTLMAIGFADVFVTKYDSNGKLMWVTQAGGSHFGTGKGIASDGDGNSYVTGHFRGSMTFGEGTNAITLVSDANTASSQDIFVAQYDINGNLIWALRDGSEDTTDIGIEIDVDSADSVYIVGDFQAEATFGEGANAVTLTSVNFFDAFLVKYTERSAQEIIYVSSNSAGSVEGVSFNDEDILAYNQTTGQWSKYFDGSDMGLRRNDINAFTVLENGHILMSFNVAGNIPGFGAVDDSDIVKFIPTSVGESTAGSFERFLDGSDVGLASGAEDIDAIAMTPDGQLTISTRGSFQVPNLSGADEDLIVLNNASFGSNSSGDWALYFDGSDVGLTATDEDVTAVWIDGDSSDILLNTKGDFSVNGANGDESDIFACVPGSTGNTTACTFSLFWDGSSAGFGGENIDGIAIGDDSPIANSADIGNGDFDDDVEGTYPEDEDEHDRDVDESESEGLNHDFFLPIIVR